MNPSRDYYDRVVVIFYDISIVPYWLGGGGGNGLLVAAAFYRAATGRGQRPELGRARAGAAGQQGGGRSLPVPTSGEDWGVAVSLPDDGPRVPTLAQTPETMYRSSQ